MLQLPFFPMRPKHGAVFNEDTVDKIMEMAAVGDTVQLKINGDRAVMSVDIQGKVFMCNRHGSEFKHTVLNKAKFSVFAGSVFDGEVIDRTFYPFEAILFLGLQLAWKGPAEREQAAKEACATLNLPWIYEISREILSKLHLNLPRIEGVVVKKAGTPYIRLGSAGQESQAWTKLRWSPRT